MGMGAHSLDRKETVGSFALTVRDSVPGENTNGVGESREQELTLANPDCRQTLPLYLKDRYLAFLLLMF